MSPDSVLHMLQRVPKRAGLPRIRFHDLRHTFATMALQNGVDVKTVSSMLGHYSAGFTLDTYHAAKLLEKSNAQSRQNTPCAPFQEEPSPSRPQGLKDEFEPLSEEFAGTTGFPPKPSEAGSVGEGGAA